VVTAVLLVVLGPAGRPDHDQQHCYYHAPTVKPEAATADVEILMMGMRTPETCWAVNKSQVINGRNFCIWLEIIWILISKSYVYATCWKYQFRRKPCRPLNVLSLLYGILQNTSTHCSTALNLFCCQWSKFMVKVDSFEHLSLYIFLHTVETKQNYGRKFSKVCYL